MAIDSPMHKLPAASSSESDCEPIAKLKLPSPTRMLCIPCVSRSIESEDSFSIYMVDLSSPSTSVDDRFISLAPMLRLDHECFDAYSMCVLGSTVYMFQTETGPSDVCDGINPEAKSVATIDLSHYFNRSNVKLEKRMLTYTPPMLHPKKSPNSTPTPDGRILVFSSVIWFDPFDETDAQIDFELYDPHTRLWQQLPGIHDKWDEDLKLSRSSFFIEAFAFLNDCTLFVKIDFGMFTLDLKSPNTGGWLEQDDLAGATELPDNADYFSVIEEELCISACSAFDIESPEGLYVCYAFPRTPFTSVKYKMRIPCGITFTGVDGESNFCRVQTALDGETLLPHMTIDVYRYDLAKYREDKQKSGGSAMLSTNLVKSFKFLLDAYKCASFIPKILCHFKHGCRLTEITRTSRRVSSEPGEQQVEFDIPTEVLELILSQLNLTDNIRSSAVCGSWLAVAASVRRANQPPWLMFFPKYGEMYEFYDPSQHKTYRVEMPQLRGSRVCYAKDGWLLLCKPGTEDIFFFCPYTREKIELPKLQLSNQIVAFSAAPTCPSCLLFIAKNVTG